MRSTTPHQKMPWRTRLLPKRIGQRLALGFGALVALMLLALGYAYEQAAQARKPPTYIPSLESRPDSRAAFGPAK